MIRVTVLYPNEPDKKFDLEDFAGRHMALVHKRLDPLGLVRTEVDKGVGTVEPGALAPFITIAHLYFNSLEDLHKAFESHGAELMADIPNFSDIQPQLQISEIVA